MRVELTTDRVCYGNVQRDGEILDLPDDEARALIAADSAKPIDTNQAGADASKPADIFPTNKQRTRRR